jgi:hypothetical protein
MTERCENIQDKIIDAMTQAPAPEVQREIDEHLAACSDCRVFVEALERDDGLFGQYVDAADEAIARVEARVDSALADAPRTEKVVSISTRRTIMKSRVFKVAAAAVVVTAAISAAGFLTGKFGGGDPVLADVLDQIEKARSVTYDVTYHYEDMDPFEIKTTATEDGMLRTERGENYISVWDINRGVTVNLWPETKRAVVKVDVGRPQRRGKFSFFQWVRTLHKGGGSFVGREDLDGETANVFVVKRDEYTTFRIWTDAESDLPLLIEETQVPNPDENIVVPQLYLAVKSFGGESNIVRTITIGGTGGIQKKSKTVFHDFTWNEAVDKSLFSTEPPAGYKVENWNIDVSDSGELALTKALKTWTDLTGAGFPEEINDLGKQELVEPILIEKYDKDGRPEDELEAALATGHVLLKGLMYAQERKVEGTWGYAGGSVEPGDKGAVVCWWLPEDEEKYRVVYGDLRIGDATLEELQQKLSARH